MNKPEGEKFLRGSLSLKFFKRKVGAPVSRQVVRILMLDLKKHCQISINVHRHAFTGIVTRARACGWVQRWQQVRGQWVKGVALKCRLPSPRGLQSVKRAVACVAINWKVS